jgi:hypothetical protein
MSWQCAGYRHPNPFTTDRDNDAPGKILAMSIQNLRQELDPAGAGHVRKPDQPAVRACTMKDEL